MGTCRLRFAYECDAWSPPRPQTDRRTNRCFPRRKRFFCNSSEMSTRSEDSFEAGSNTSHRAAVCDSRRPRTCSRSSWKSCTVAMANEANASVRWRGAAAKHMGWNRAVSMFENRRSSVSERHENDQLRPERSDDAQSAHVWIMACALQFFVGPRGEGARYGSSAAAFRVFELLVEGGESETSSQCCGLRAVPSVRANDHVARKTLGGRSHASANGC